MNFFTAEKTEASRGNSSSLHLSAHPELGKLSAESGVSLIELLVAMLLMLILIGPLFSFMRVGQITRSTSIRLSDVEQNARAAMMTIGRDLQNAGYNFVPRIDLGASQILRPLNGTGANFLTPIIPGNDLNLVSSTNSAGSAVSNKTDQITVIFVNQNFNNGLPLSGSISTSDIKYVSDAAFTNLYIGDFVLLSSGQNFGTGVVTGLSGTTIELKSTDSYGLNQPGSGPLSTLDPGQTGINIGLYKFFIVSYFVDGSGNLIRREQLPPPHTTNGGNNTMTPAAITQNSSTYNCAAVGTCYYDNLIATNIEDLQFTYYLADTSASGITGPIDDPGFYGNPANCGAAPAARCGAPNYRLLDIRQIRVSIKARASERDTKIRDPYNPRQGYFYRFTLEGTFNTRNFYGSDYRPL
jgi:Tfp pilus assembly protein PilV